MNVDSQIVVPRRSSRKPNQRRIASKLAKAALAKTTLGRANYLTDAFFEELLQNKTLDEAAHLLAEVALGKGSILQRLQRWERKSRKYRRR